MLKQIEFTLPERYTTPKTKATSERSSLIEPFVERLNASRKDAGYKPYTTGYICSKMAYIATDELKPFYDRINDGGRDKFCALWHWTVSPKKK
jgi:hypothetical protein